MNKNENPETPICGVVMPISAINGRSADHWAEVKSILEDAIKAAGFEARLVSDADESGVIQKRIIQNLYSNAVVVCDVSGKNPNVMFELGLRLAFDKPTIVVKDDATDYSFDTGVIEHLGYPRDLRFAQIVSFKTKLSEKLKKTHKAAMADPNYSTFLKNFGEYKVAQLDEREVTSSQLVLAGLEELRVEVSRLRRFVTRPTRRLPSRRERELEPSAQAMDAVRDVLAQFLEENGLSDTNELVGREEEVFAYVEKDARVQIECGDPDTVRECVSRQIPF